MTFRITRKELLNSSPNLTRRDTIPLITLYKMINRH